MNSQGKIRSSDFSANDFPGKERHIWALSIRPNFPAQKYPNFLDPFLGKDLFLERIFTVAVSRISKFLVEWEAPILQFV